MKVGGFLFNATCFIFFFPQKFCSRLAKATTPLKSLNLIITPSKGSTTSLFQFILQSTLEKVNIREQFSAYYIWMQTKIFTRKITNCFQIILSACREQRKNLNRDLDNGDRCWIECYPMLDRMMKIRSYKNQCNSSGKCRYTNFKTELKQ